MKRSEVNQAVKQASDFFNANGWTLPPDPIWDVTDFGLGNFKQYGLILINLASEAEYSEKLIYATRKQQTPAHCHRKKKEDIACRLGILVLRLWPEIPYLTNQNLPFEVQINNKMEFVFPGQEIILKAGERITLIPGMYHEFYPDSKACILSEVSTANDDLNDNFFANPKVGRFSEIEEDEPACFQLIND
ncbi:D-lyxose/D-mannose family sugar isomerase [Pararhodonellum marinum]|uniref:D-lyxose/D-mannose family sugar isomerase n=1 Tax=Pararhodonellum marinum TaxID=2755358 RepID=UPI00188DD5D5|nr:D-lyxose/D-mannose family sugar isomerase [Pararhodonellum marinum]